MTMGEDSPKAPAQRRAQFIAAMWSLVGVLYFAAAAIQFFRGDFHGGTAGFAFRINLISGMAAFGVAMINNRETRQ